jgi:hypothetical protein
MKSNSIIARTARTALVAALAGAACLSAGTAFAQPFAQPDAQRYAPPARYGEPHLMPVDLNVETGVHGDRYWDGHRYWDHDDWMRHHPRDRDPWHHDHRMSPHHDEPHRD